MTKDADSLIIAFATVDGVTIPKAHCGEAQPFEIYRLTASDATRLESVTNLTAGEGHGAGSHRHHADGGGKGAGIGRLLAEHGVQVMVSRAFGQNIVRMRERFLPVKVGAQELAAASSLLQRHWEQVQSHWLQGPARKHLVLRSHPGAAVGYLGGMAGVPDSAPDDVPVETNSSPYTVETMHRYRSCRHRYAVGRTGQAGVRWLGQRATIDRPRRQLATRRV